MTNGTDTCNYSSSISEEYCYCSCKCINDSTGDLEENWEVKLFTHWRALDSNVGNLLGLDISANMLYGLSHNGLAVMRSEDYGDNWVSIPTEYWTAATNTDTYVSAVSLKDEALLLQNPSFNLTFTSNKWNSTWGVSGIGIHIIKDYTTNWEVVGTWKCCGDVSP